MKQESPTSSAMPAPLRLMFPLKFRYIDLKGRYMKKSFVPFIVVLLVSAACGDGGDRQDFVRQASFGEPGGEIGVRLEREPSVSKYAMPDELVQISKVPEPLYPSKELLEILGWLEKGVGRIPVMLQLPVTWTPEGVLAGGPDLSKSREVREQRGRISRAAQAVQRSLFANRDYVESSIDLDEFERLYLEWQGNENRLGKEGDSSKLSQGRAKEESRVPGRLNQTARRQERTQARIVAGDYFASLSPVPGVRALVTVDELQDLYKKRLIVGVDIDGVEFPSLVDSSSDALMGTDSVSSLWGVDGAGTTVAILDSGVYLNHPAFAGRIVSQACYTVDNSCPLGAATSTLAGSATPCTGQSTTGGWRCDHGTHVAGIAVGGSVATGSVPGNGGSVEPADGWHVGVAPGANLMAIRIANNSSSASLSSYVLGWNRVAALAFPLNIVSANLSYGPANSPANAPCDGTWSAGETALSNLVSVNVAPTKSSGNDGFPTAVGGNSCISNFVVVGNTTDGDAVSNTSNFHSTLLDIQAPGTGIVAASGVARAGGSTPQGSLEFEAKTGTSMAAPQVAGAWALARQLMPTANVATIRSLFRGTGVPVSDNRTLGTGLWVPRLDVAAALPVYSALGTLPDHLEFYPGKRRTYSEGTGLRKERLGPAVPVSQWKGTINLSESIVNTASAGARDKAYLYFSTRGAPASAVRVNGTWYWSGQEEFETLGVSTAPCRELGPLRSYRIDMSNNQDGLVKGNNEIMIQVASPSGTADGASILLIGSPSRSNVSSKEIGVILSHGVSVLDETSVASAALTVSVPLDDRYLRLHVGVGDGQASYESGILFRTSTNAFGKVVTPDSMFSGSDGFNWDDITFNLTGSGLTGYPGLAVISHNEAEPGAVRDCLGWIYTALNIHPGILDGWQVTVPGVDFVPQGWNDIPIGVDPLNFMLPFDFGEFDYPPPDLIPFVPQPVDWPAVPK